LIVCKGGTARPRFAKKVSALGAAPRWREWSRRAWEKLEKERRPPPARERAGGRGGGGGGKRQRKDTELN
jgi:hypothetical protein